MQLKNRKDVLKKLILMGGLLLFSGVLFIIFSLFAEAEKELVPVDEQLNAYLPSKKMTGTLRIAGSDTMQHLLIYLAEGFRKEHPDVDFIIQGDGTFTGYRELLDGHVDIAAASTEWTSEAVAEFQQLNGREAVPLVIARDALVIYVHLQNPIEYVTLNQLNALFAGSEIQSWRDLVKSAPEDVIHRYVRDDNSGSHAFLLSRIGDAVQGTCPDPKSIMPGNLSIVQRISTDPRGTGYASYAYRNPEVKMLGIQDQSFPIYPTADSIAAGAYPLTRALILYLPPSGTAHALTEEWLRFILSQSGQQIVSRSGFVPLTKEQCLKERKLLNEGTSL